MIRGSRGVTLVELMVVVVVVGIASTFLVPSLSRSLQRTDARKAGAMVSDYLRTVRDHSMATGQALGVTLATPSDAQELGLVQTFSGMGLPSCVQDSDCVLGAASAWSMCRADPRSNIGRCVPAARCQQLPMTTAVPAGQDGGLPLGLQIGGKLEILSMASPCFEPDGRSVATLADTQGVSCAEESVIVLVRSGVDLAQAQAAQLCNCGRAGSGPDAACVAERDRLGLVRVEVDPSGLIRHR